MPKIEATSWGLHNSKLVITKMISWDKYRLWKYRSKPQIQFEEEHVELK